MEDIIVLWLFETITGEWLLPEKGVYCVGPIRRNTTPTSHETFIHTAKGENKLCGRWISLEEELKAGYFAPSFHSKYESVIEVTLTPKGLDYMRKRLREIINNEEVIIAATLCGETVVSDILNTYEENKEIGHMLLSSVKIKLVTKR